MKTLWISYAWADNKNQDIDFIAQELVAAGIEVKLDRWNLKAGTRLWDQIDEFISSEQQSDGWMLVATQNSLSSEPCREEFAYALERALKERGNGFPILALFMGPVDNALVPAAIKVRLHVSTSDVDWKERIKAALKHDFFSTRIVMAGGGGGAFRTGRYLKYGETEPNPFKNEYGQLPGGNFGSVSFGLGPAVNKLYVSIMQAMGLTNNSIGATSSVGVGYKRGVAIDMTGPLPRLV